MVRTLHLIVWITIMTAPGYKCKRTRSASHSSFYDDNPSQESLGILDNPAYEWTSQNTDKIVFSGPTTEEFQLEIPENCRGFGFCEDIPNYPIELAKKVISELLKSGKFQENELDPELPDITQRVGRYEENRELCDFDEKSVYPKAAVDPSGKWHVVLNQDKNPVQIFKAEICKKNDEGETSKLKIREKEWQKLSHCSGVAIFNEEYEGHCKQKYLYITMTVLLQNGTCAEKLLQMPSCCSCLAYKLKSSE